MSFNHTLETIFMCRTKNNFIIQAYTDRSFQQQKVIFASCVMAKMGIYPPHRLVFVNFRFINFFPKKEKKKSLEFLPAESADCCRYHDGRPAREEGINNQNHFIVDQIFSRVKKTSKRHPFLLCR